MTGNKNAGWDLHGGDASDDEERRRKTDGHMMDQRKSVQME